MWITQSPKIVVNLLENLQIFHTNGTVVLGKVILTEKCRWVPLMSQQTEVIGRSSTSFTIRTVRPNVDRTGCRIRPFSLTSLC